MIKFRGVYTVTVEEKVPAKVAKARKVTAERVWSENQLMPARLRHILADSINGFAAVTVTQESSEVWEEEG